MTILLWGGLEIHVQAENPMSPDTRGGFLQQQVGLGFFSSTFFLFFFCLSPLLLVLSAAYNFSGTNLGLGRVPLMFGKSEQPWLRCQERGERAHSPWQF